MSDELDVPTPAPMPDDYERPEPITIVHPSAWAPAAIERAIADAVAETETAERIAAARAALQPRDPA